jgi:cold shock CspA family protein
MNQFFDMEKLKDLPKQNDLKWDLVIDGRQQMTGKIIRILLDKKFGFIKGEDNKDYFFHSTDFNGFFNDLGADYKSNRIIMVSFEPCESKKGLRAANVVRLDGGV